MSHLMHRLGALCVRRKWIVVAVWVVVVLIVGAAVYHYGRQTTNDITLPGTGYQASADMLREEFPPQQNGASPIVFHVESGKLTDPANKKAIEDVLTAIEAMPETYSVFSPFARGGDAFMSEDEQTAVAQVLLNLDWGQLDKTVASRVMAEAEAGRGGRHPGGGGRRHRRPPGRADRPQERGHRPRGGPGHHGLHLRRPGRGRHAGHHGAGRARSSGSGWWACSATWSASPTWPPRWRPWWAWASASTTRSSSSSATATSSTAAWRWTSPSPSPWPRAAAPWCSPAPPSSWRCSPCWWRACRCSARWATRPRSRWASPCSRPSRCCRPSWPSWAGAWTRSGCRGGAAPPRLPSDTNLWARWAGFVTRHPWAMLIASLLCSRRSSCRCSRCASGRRTWASCPPPCRSAAPST